MRRCLRARIGLEDGRHEAKKYEGHEKEDDQVPGGHAQRDRALPIGRQLDHSAQHEVHPRVERGAHEHHAKPGGHRAHHRAPVEKGEPPPASAAHHGGAAQPRHHGESEDEGAHPRPHTTPSPTALPPRVKESRWRSALATSPTVAATTQNARMAPLLAHSCGRSERPCYDGSVARSAFRFWFTIIVIPTLLVVGALGYLAWRQSVSGVRAAFDPPPKWIGVKTPLNVDLRAGRGSLRSVEVRLRQGSAKVVIAQQLFSGPPTKEQRVALQV